MKIKTTEDTLAIDIHFKRGIFQGNSLSPLVFCLSIATPVSHIEENGGLHKHGHTPSAHSSSLYRRPKVVKEKLGVSCCN